MRFVLFCFAAVASFFTNLYAGDTPSVPPQNKAESTETKLQSLIKLRDQEKLLAKEAYREADMYFSKDWFLYRRALLKHEYLQKRVKELDLQIAELEKRK